MTGDCSFPFFPFFFLWFLSGRMGKIYSLRTLVLGRFCGLGLRPFFLFFFASALMEEGAGPEFPFLSTLMRRALEE